MFASFRDHVTITTKLQSDQQGDPPAAQLSRGLVINAERRHVERLVGGRRHGGAGPTPIASVQNQKGYLRFRGPLGSGESQPRLQTPVPGSEGLVVETSGHCC